MDRATSNGTSEPANKDLRRSKNSHTDAKAIASTAGRDNWQTWAGRKHGSEDFEFLDVFRGVKRSLHNTYLRSKSLPKGTTCPICFCEPENSKDWYVTWCGHGVCKDCLGQYASTQVKDKEQSGPLQCPVCLKTLRKQDAVVAMMASKNNDEVIQEWDRKILEQLLRAVPSFRSCPKCGTNDNTNGGGFVTPECLAPHHQERRDAATRILLQRNLGYTLILLVYMSCVGWIASNPSPSSHLDLYSMLLPIYFFAKLGMALQYGLATRAREALFRPIAVGCPCCDQSFVLATESSTDFHDEESSRWMKANTRPCPSCSVPIVKSSGCNHMKCSHCKADFCWACMRLRTTCRAYKCSNGAKYGNASIFQQTEEEQERMQALRSDGSILTYIDYILNHRRGPAIHASTDGLLLAFCLIGRHFGPLVALEGWITSLTLNIVLPAVIYFVTPATMVLSTFLHMRRTAQPPRENPQVAGQFIETLNQNMLREALQRSIEET